MATKSITKNIEITDSIKAKRLVEALEVAERIGEDMPEILNKKQLEDAIKCRDFGTGCCDKNKKLCSVGGVGICDFSGDMDCGSDSYRSRDPAKVGSITCRKER